VRETLRSAVAAGRVLLADGATGTELQAAGVEPGSCLERLNLERPEVVARLHRRYLEAGSRLLTTNSFGGTRLRLAFHGLEEKAAALNRAAAHLARGEADEDVWVLGSVGPFGGILEPLGDASREAVRDAYREQIDALLEGGVDAILVETMTDTGEMAIAVEQAREAGAPFVIASFAFDRVRTGIPRTMMGVAPAEAARAAAAAGADMVGCNCGTALDGDGYVAIVEELVGSVALPGLAQPNAGLPELTRSGVVYRETPESMARTAVRLAAAGATIVGGCCGSTPEHIARFRASLAGRGA